MNEHKQTVNTDGIITGKMKDVATEDFAKIGGKLGSYQKDEGQIGGKLGSDENEAKVMLLKDDGTEESGGCEGVVS